MISKSFCGIPLKTVRSRRVLVVGYYLVLAFFLTVGLLKTHAPAVMPLITLTLLMGGLLGGIQSNGPVKPYTDLPAGVSNDPIQELKLSSPQKPRPDSIWLDERETSTRNEAHYRAYAILRWIVGTGGIAWLAAQVWAHNWMQAHTLLLLWTFVVFVLSLPQAVILWREPEADDDNAATVAATIAGRA